MSVERELVKVDTPPNESPEAKEIETRAQKKSRIASILDRGIINDRIHVPVPDDKYGEWVRDDPFEINRMKLIGFEDGSEYVKNRTLHGEAKVGDVVFMITSRENKELIEEVREDQRRILHREKGKEEQEFESQMARDTGGIIPTFIESKQRDAKLADVKAALAAAEKQTQLTR